MRMTLGHYGNVIMCTCSDFHSVVFRNHWKIASSCDAHSCCTRHAVLCLRFWNLMKKKRPFVTNVFFAVIFHIERSNESTFRSTCSRSESHESSTQISKMARNEILESWKLTFSRSKKIELITWSNIWLIFTDSKQSNRIASKW